MELDSIAIVGGGPAGSLAAAMLANRGRRVRLFDEKLAWEKPCGGGLTHKALKQYPFLTEPSVNGGDRRGSIDKSPIEHRQIDHCELISPSGKQVRFRIQHPVAIFSRLALNGLVLDRARSAGAEVRQERVTKIAGSAGDWRIITPAGEYRAPHVILAAGARNALRAQFLAPIDCADLMVTVGYFIPRQTSLMQIQFLKGITGYIWVFPRTDHVSAGIAGKMGETSTRELRRTLEDWLAKNGHSLVGASLYSHILPSFRAHTMERNEVCGDGWAAIGDSAGLVDPITGEGLYYALRSAELCAEALIAGQPFQYKARLEEEVLRELHLAARVSQRFYTGEILGESVLEQMITLTSKSESFRQLMSDLFAGVQGYRDLKARLYRILPSVMAEGVAGKLRGAWSRDTLAADSMAD